MKYYLSLQNLIVLFATHIKWISSLDGDKHILGINTNFPMFLQLKICASIEYFNNFFTDNLVPLQKPSFTFKFHKRITIALIFNFNLCGGSLLGVYELRNSVGKITSRFCSLSSSAISILKYSIVSPSILFKISLLM